jgi:hypothetical protein
MATQPPYNPQYGAPPPMAPPPAPKKLGPLAWILIIFGGLVALMIVAVIGIGLFAVHKLKQAGFDPELMRSNPALATAKMVTALNPDLEVVNVDDARGIIRVHDKRQNKNFLLNFEDAKHGRMVMQEEGKQAVTITAAGEGASGAVEMKSSEGSFKIGGNAPVNLPSWVPNYPGSQPQAAFTADGADGKRVVYAFKTSDPSDKVVEFYKSGLGSGGLAVENATMSASGGNTGGMVSAKDSSGKRQAMVTVGTENGQTSVTVTYVEKK